MYQNVHAVVNNHQSSWSQVPGIVSVVEQFEILLDNLIHKLNAQNTLTKGVKLEKDSFLDEFVHLMSIMKKALTIHAVQTKNLKLRERNKETEGRLRNATVSRLQVITSNLLEDLDSYESALSNLGVTSERIQKFRDQALLLEEQKISVRQAIIDRSIETKGIKDVDQQLNKLLIEQLDHCVSLLDDTDSNFLAEYKAARKTIVKSGGSKNNQSTT